MGYARRKVRPEPAIQFNPTPLIDVIFTLTIFFMLVSKFSSAEQVTMLLPEPEESQARLTKLPDRVVVNCRLAGSGGVEEQGRGDDEAEVLYSIGPNQPEALEVIADRLGLMKLQSPRIQVVIRADRRLPYADVRALMRVIADHGIEVLNVVAHVAEDR